MTLSDALAYGEPHFEFIKRLVKEGLTNDANAYIRETPPPQEWLVEYPSLLDAEQRFYTIPIQILEQAAYRIYGDWRIKNIYTPDITHEKGKVAVTTTITVKYKTLDNSDEYLQGVASEFASGIHYLPLLTAKTIASAKKHAFKQLGAFFGGELNRTLDEFQFTVTDEPAKVAPEIKRLRELIEKSTTLESLAQHKQHIQVGDKETYDLYMNKVKELSKE
jgi:hypothetical protein